MEHFKKFSTSIFFSSCVKFSKWRENAGKSLKWHPMSLIGVWEGELLKTGSYFGNMCFMTKAKREREKNIRWKQSCVFLGYCRHNIQSNQQLLDSGYTLLAHKNIWLSCSDFFVPHQVEEDKIFLSGSGGSSIIFSPPNRSQEHAKVKLVLR